MNLHAVVERWIDNNLDQVMPKRPISSHIDEILADSIAIADWYSISISLFELVVEILLEKQMPVKAMLSIRLESLSNHIEFAQPSNIEEIKRQLSEEPPSLYLIDWQLSKLGAFKELYHVGLPYRLTSRHDASIYSYYVEVRYKTEIEYDEYFWRYIRLEYLPLGINK